MTDSGESDLQHRWRQIELAGRVSSWEWRVPENRLTWSPHTAALFGIDRAPATYEEFIALVHPEDRERVDAETQAYLAQGGSFEHEFRVIDRGGGVRWILGRGEVAAIPVGQRPALMFGLSIDVTAQKRAEALLSESEARLRAVRETARIGIHEWDIASDRMSWDPILREIWGLDDDQPIDSQVFEEGLHPEDRAATRAVVQQALLPEGGSYDTEYRVIDRRSGEARWIHAGGWVTFQGGRPSRVLGAAYEISARRNAERAARDSAATLRAAFDNAAVGIARVDAEGRWLMANDRLCEILGYPRHELLGMSFQMLTHPDDLEADLEQLERMRRGEVNTYRTEKRYLRKDGEVVWGNLSVGVVRSGDGSIHHFISVIEDISGRKQAEEQRELLVEELNHRVRNMLTVVRAIAAQTSRHSESLTAFSEAFDKRIQALAVTHTLLSRLGWSASSLDLLIEQQVRPYAPGAQMLSASGPEILLPPKPALALSLVFHELASNAARYGALSRPPGRVRVTWEIETREGGRTARLRWIEQGGPVVRPPQRTGFGSKLMDINIVHEFKGRIERDYRPEGLVCAFSLVLPDRSAG